MAFNLAMDSKPHPDATLIDQLGGPADVARLLGFDPKGGTQRVQNWKTRGIPEVIRLRRPDVFGPAPANADTLEPTAARPTAAAAGEAAEADGVPVPLSRAA